MAVVLDHAKMDADLPLVALSVRRGAIREHYGAWDRVIA
jgi:hypothetical protein